MAEVTEGSNGSSQANILKNKAKNPVGRPRADGLPAGSLKADPIALPEGEFLDQIASLEPKAWETLTIYVFRCKPITDRAASGNPKYITKYAEPIDLDRLMRDHGSGYYQLKLVQVGAGGRGGQEIKRTYVDIMNPEFPPKLYEGDWLDDVRNRDYEWARGKLERAPSTHAGSTADEIAGAFLKLQSAMPRTDSGAAMFAALAPLLDPQRQTDMLATFAGLMKPQDGTLTAILPLLLKLLEKPATDPMLTMLIEDRKTMAAEMAELRKSMMTPQKHPLEFLFEHEELGKRLFGRGAGGASSEGKTWVDIVEKGIDKLAPGINTLAQAGAAFAMRGTQPAPVQPNPARTITVQPQPTPPQSVESPAPVPQTAAPQSPQEQPQDMNQIALMQKYGGVIQQAFPFLVDHYKDDERDGYDFRDWFIKPQRFGNQVWFNLRQDVGVDGIMMLLKSLPAEVQAQLAPEDKFRKFLGEFFTEPGAEPPGTYSEDEPPTEDEPENEFEVRP